MVDNLIKGVIFGVLVYAWYYAGVMVPWINDGANMVTGFNGDTYAVPGLGYLVWSIFAIALARGK